VKYGARSADEGVLDVSGGTVGEDVQITWTEQAGPEVPPPTEFNGYGSSLVRRTLEDQLDGSVTYDWTKSGALVTLVISGERLSQ
jgi:two-component sensor histidine kinase